jgi:hypothetical protein
VFEIYNVFVNRCWVEGFIHWFRGYFVREAAKHGCWEAGFFVCRYWAIDFSVFEGFWVIFEVEFGFEFFLEIE